MRVQCDNPIISRRTAAVFALPTLVFIGVFLAFPALWAMYIGLTNLRLTGISAIQPRFVGLANFVSILRDSFFHNSLRITAQFVLGSALIGQLLLGLLLAVLLYNVKGPINDFVSSIVILAWIIPEVVVAYLWVAFLDYDFGLLNATRNLLGMPAVNGPFDHCLQHVERHCVLNASDGGSLADDTSVFPRNRRRHWRVRVEEIP